MDTSTPSPNPTPSVPTQSLLELLLRLAGAVLVPLVGAWAQRRLGKPQTAPRRRRGRR